ncbi:unnamed protein product, partial [Rotaria magnacalcarata]
MPKLTTSATTVTAARVTAPT